MPTIDQIVTGWKSHFFAADREIEWVATEVEHAIEIMPGVMLMGRIDAFGKDANGDMFFGEWKTANPRKRTGWKETWRLNPQSLTYGVLAQTLYPGCRRFTVRQAFKSDPPSYDHAWYSYSEAELEHWRDQLLQVAMEIRSYGQGTPWPTNFSSCFLYGQKYPCPFYENGCSKLNWAALPSGSIPRVSHLDSERRLYAGDGARPIVLDATRVKIWFECRERFRKEYMVNIAMPPGEALQTGIAFHDQVGEMYSKMVKGAIK